VAAIRRLAERGVDLELGIAVMSLNRHSHRGAISHAEELGIPWTALPKILARKDGNPQPIALRMDDGDLVRFFSGSTCSEGDDFPGENSGALCAAGVRFANITPSGDVLACNIMPVVAGNIRDTSFREIWRESPFLQRLRGIRRDDLTMCSTCEWFSQCGRCPAQALVEDGDLLGPSRDACAHVKARDQAGGGEE
jgi:radical SAM protein with 4Fe4S-binding SPASM domain